MLTSQTHSAREWELSAGCLGKCSCCIPEARGQVLRMGPAQEQAVPQEASPWFILVLQIQRKGKF